MLWLINETAKLVPNLCFSQTIMLTITWTLPLPDLLPLPECLAEGPRGSEIHLHPWRHPTVGIDFIQTHHGCSLPLELLFAPTTGQTYTEHPLYSQPCAWGWDRSIRHSCYPYIVYNLALGKSPLKTKQSPAGSFPALMCDLYSKLFRFAHKDIKSFTLSI